MDEPEREYLWQRIKSLEKAKRRWKALAVFLLAAFGLFVILGMGTAYFTHNVFRLRQEAMLARMQAEEEAQRAREAEMQAKQAAAKNQVDREPRGDTKQ